MAESAELNVHNTMDTAKINHSFSAQPDLETLRRRMHDFADARDWHQFHSPRNLLLALVGEVGELAELFQWKGEVAPGLPDWTDEEKQHVGEEMSDVLLYLVRMADRCGVDLPKAALEKLDVNERKYPVDKVKGSEKKYTHYLDISKDLAEPSTQQQRQKPS